MISPGFGAQISDSRRRAGMKDDRLQSSQKLSNPYTVLGIFKGTMGFNSVLPIMKSEKTDTSKEIA
jgi:hypothetical protein